MKEVQITFSSFLFEVKSCKKVNQENEKQWKSASFETRYTEIEDWSRAEEM